MIRVQASVCPPYKSILAVARTLSVKAGVAPTPNPLPLGGGFSIYLL